ncbi:MAG: N-acetyl-gamma-glutamyl-phosphate reductase [Anaerolineae bacterium]
MVKIGIMGAAGYTGFELVSIFARHPEAEIVFATSGSNAGQLMRDIYPCPWTTPLIDPAEAPLDKADVVFLCTPHGASAQLAAQVLAAGARCIDLSADFRLHDQSVYEKWYQPHTAPELLPLAVYGLTELHRADIEKARLIANPGCYPTGPILALTPLLEAGMLTEERIIIDAASGVSGAGVKPTPTVHFVTVHDNYSVYKPGHTHRHVPEIEQELSAAAGSPRRIVFTPHLLPVSRGILSTIYVNLDPMWTEVDIQNAWELAYGGEPFIHVLQPGKLATLAHVVNTNRCAISATPAGAPGEWIIVTAIDNLVKGAAGQAVQNMNVAFGLPEGHGLIA